MMSKVLYNTGVTVGYIAMICKAVVQTVLLYGRENSVIVDATMKVLEAFHHRIARRIMGKMSRRIRE